MLEEEKWDLVEGFGLLEENLYSDFMFFMPSVCLNWLDSLTAHYLQKGTYRQSHGTEQVPFVLFIDPTIMYSNTTVFFLGMDVFLISQHAEYQAWQGNGAVILQNYFCGLRQAVPVRIPQHTLKEG